MISELFWLGLWVTLALTVFTIVLTIIFTGFTLLAAGVEWLWEKWKHHA